MVETQHLREVPDFPAPPIPAYPQFSEVEIPSGSDAVRAFRGYIRPFSDDATACRVMRAIQANEPMLVSAGRLDYQGDQIPAHPLEPFVRDVAEPCTVLILEFAGEEHHRAYLIDPPLISRVSENPHLRWDRTLLLGARRSPALCIYSGCLFSYDPGADRLTQFLNQLSTYLAKHLFFLRTRMLYSKQKDGSLRLVKRRNPWEPIRTESLGLSKNFVWFGHWIGEEAPSHPFEHLRTIKPEQHCWCNSGKTYGDCHKPSELLLLVRLRQSNGQCDPLRAGALNKFTCNWPQT